MHLFQQLQLWAAFIVVIFLLFISKKTVTAPAVTVFFDMNNVLCHQLMSSGLPGLLMIPTGIISK